MVTLIRGFLRGWTAWVLGYVATLIFVVGGAVETSGGAFGGAASAFVDAHRFVLGDVVDPAFLIAVPIAAVGLTGYRAGRGLTSGLTGRLRSFVRSVTGSDGSRIPQAVRAAVYVAGAYALVASIAALLIGASVGETALTSLLFGLVVGVPAAIVGVVR